VSTRAVMYVVTVRFLNLTVMCEVRFMSAGVQRSSLLNAELVQVSTLMRGLADLRIDQKYALGARQV